MYLTAKYMTATATTTLMISESIQLAPRVAVVVPEDNSLEIQSLDAAEGPSRGNPEWASSNCEFFIHIFSPRPCGCQLVYGSYITKLLIILFAKPYPPLVPSLSTGSSPSADWRIAVRSGSERSGAILFDQCNSFDAD
jgi:hypothetical protein